jgi:hypothetical protein
VTGVKEGDRRLRSPFFLSTSLDAQVIATYSAL